MNSIFSKKISFQTVIAAALIFAVLNIFVPLNFPSQAEASEYPFNLTITLEKSTYNLGEQVNVTWTLTNIGEENITLYNSLDWFDLIVYDEHFLHTFQYRGYYGLLGIIYPFRPIPPGDNMTEIGTWKQIFDGTSNVRPELRLKKVPPGTYYITGIFSSSTYNIMLQTPVLRIKIGG